MILILIAIIVTMVIGIALVRTDTDTDINELFGVILLFLSGISGAIYSFVGWSYFAAEYKADIINREYGTNYTQEEVFWASDVIDTVRELNRQRIELNGDLLQDKND